MPRTIVVVTLLPLFGILTGCATNDTTLGENEGSSVVGGPSGTAGPNEGGDQDGACLAPSLFPVSDDAWWQTAWSPSLPVLPRASCGGQNNPDVSPAVVGVWTAPEDGEYFARGWADFNAVITGTPDCGVMAMAGCAMLNAQTLPEPPWDVRALPGGGFNLHAKAGDRWFFSFQNLDRDNAPPPDHGIGVANISTVSW